METKTQQLARELARYGYTDPWWSNGVDLKRGWYAKHPQYGGMIYLAETHDKVWEGINYMCDNGTELYWD